MKFSVNDEFKSVKELVLHVLEHYPECRDNDNKLFVRCAELLGINSLTEFEDMNLNLISVYKVRQKIQNKEKLYQPNEFVRNLRSERQRDIKQVIAAI